MWVEQPVALFEPSDNALDRLGEILEGNVVRAPARCEKRCLVDEVRKIGAREAGSQRCDLVDSDTCRHLDLAKMRQKDVSASLLVRPVN